MRPGIRSSMKHPAILIGVVLDPKIKILDHTISSHLTPVETCRALSLKP